MTNDIEFPSQGATLRGQLLLPDKDTKNAPAIIMAHGFSTTTRMTADKYAEEFRKAGFVVILYDHRNLGDSGGEPRQDVNYGLQARGYIDCLDFAETRPEVDPSRIALWGCSSSGRLVYVVSSIDPRPKAIVAQVPAFGAEPGTEDKNGRAYAFNKEVILSENILDRPHNTHGPVPVVSMDQEAEPSYLYHKTAANWFLEFGNRPGTGWINEVTVSRVEDPFAYHPYHSAKHVSASTLFVVAGDDEIEGADPAVVKQVFDRIDQPKDWVSITGGHFGLLHYPSALFDEVSQEEIKFLRSVL